MRPEISGVIPFGDNAWEVKLVWPNGHRFYRVKGRRDHPDELSAYTATLKELEDEYPNG